MGAPGKRRPVLLCEYVSEHVYAKVGDPFPDDDTYKINARYQRYSPTAETHNIAMYINTLTPAQLMQGRSFNCYGRIVRVKRGGSWKYVFNIYAKRDLERGEELVWDYGSGYVIAESVSNPVMDIEAKAPSSTVSVVNGPDEEWSWSVSGKVMVDLPVEEESWSPVKPVKCVIDLTKDSPSPVRARPTIKKAIINKLVSTPKRLGRQAVYTQLKLSYFYTASNPKDVE
jgi:hypothetical protein